MAVTALTECLHERDVYQAFHSRTDIGAMQADLTHENWVGVLQQVDIPAGGNPDSFLQQAVNLANNRCWGTLSCSLIVDPATQKQHQVAVDSAIADLRYGSVNVNLPTILGYAMMKMAWGGFAGSNAKVTQIL